MIVDARRSTSDEHAGFDEVARMGGWRAGGEVDGVQPGVAGGEGYVDENCLA